ncbi:MAG TPA: electron transport complex subunit RsxC [Ruminococcaceae bacterium]|nr:electron transport complex subunit RsxC [Oscillospiraceae bacterium]
MELSFPTKPFRTHGGAAVPHMKHTAQTKSVVMPVPNAVAIPMQMHVGAPCSPLVKPGDLVTVGQKIGDSKGFVSAPIHASISGKVKAIQKVQLCNGSYSTAVVIESDGKMEMCPDLKAPEVTDLKSFLQAVRDSGLVGLGGAGFPTHVKLNVPEGKTVDTLIVNVAECEPYLTADNREALENSASVLDGVFLVMKMLKLSRGIIAVESNKPEVIQQFRSMLASDQRNSSHQVGVLPLRAAYPQGAEKVLIKSCTDRTVPMGKLPADVGCIVMNVTSIAFLADYMKTGIPLVKKRLTIDGSAVKNRENVIVPIGTRIRDILEFVGMKCEPAKILVGGPMMGMSVPTVDAPVQKQNNGLIFLDEAEAHEPETTACIRCGRCVMGCPMHLMPTKLETYAKAKDVDALQAYDVMDCMECGTCAFNCPANRPLVQAIRMGKALVKAGGAKK